MTQEQYRRRWMIQHRGYEKLAYSIFLESFRDVANKIPFNFINESNYEIIIQSTISRQTISESYFKVYSEVGKIHGQRVGKSINKQIKEFTLSSFLNQFEKNLLEWLFNNAGTRIVSVRDTYAKYIVDFIGKGILSDMTLVEVVRELEKAISSPKWYRWQLLRIARTETTAAANYGSTIASTISGVATDKVWISAVDARTRKPPKSSYNHLAMNGTRVPQFEKFNVNGDLIDFPGDPKGKAQNIINCRCSSTVVVRRDKNGKIIRI